MQHYSQGKRFLLSLVLTLLALSAFAQRPVQVITTVRPAYSTLLSEYYSGDQEKLSVMLINTDASQPFLQVYLRMTIEGQGVKLQTTPYGNYPTIDVMQGAPVTVSQSDLAPYFSSQNLIGSTGAGQNRLPEGFYQFCFEVYEKNTNRLVGDKQCAQAYLTLSDPPFLTMPEKGKVISYTNPFNLLFQWTPRNLATPNAYNSEYEFTLVEIWDEGVTPEAAFYTAQPIYTTKTNTTNLFYGPAEPPLLMGKKYAWRVKQTLLTSTNQQEPFRNEGYTEIYWFKLQGECLALQKATITADPKSNRTTLSWANDPTNVGPTKLEYRKKGASKWTSIEAQNHQATLTGLAWNSEYEYHLGNRCIITDEFAYGSLQNFRTLTQDTANCVPSAPQAFSNQDPIARLNAGDTIYASGFRMRLTKVTGANGNFSGEGYLALFVPTTTTEVSIKANFQGIGVNTDKQLISGKIVSMYDKTEGGIGDLDPITNGGINVGDVKTGTTTAINVNTIIDAGAGATVSVEVSSGGDTTYTVTVTGVDGKPVSINTSKVPVVVQDNTGKIYSIDKDGKITPLGQAAGQLLAGLSTEQLNTISTEKGKVSFETHADQKYALDNFQETYNKSSLFSQQYESLNNGQYRVGNKLLIDNSQDKIMVKVSNLAKDLIADSIHFITGKGVELTATKKGESLYELTLLSGPAGDAQELYALYCNSKTDTKFTLGKLKIATYEPKEFNVKLVPVGNASVDKTAMSERLNGIYNPIGISWTVELAESIAISSDWDIDQDQKLNITGAGKYNQYSEEMKLLNMQYLKSHPDIESSTPYLFVFENSPLSGTEEKGNGVLGDMLRNRQFGYIFLPGNTDVGHTAAHELAHGMFNLNHTFDTQYYLKEGDLPDNLMDYRGGSELAKLQWDAVHAPGLAIGVFESEGDGEFGVQIAQCLVGASLDFAFYYTSIWITAQFDDAIPDNKKPSFIDFEAVTTYKEFSWTEALVSAGISCAAATLPSFLAPETSRKMIVGLAALGGAATGFTTETAKQYELAYQRVKTGKKISSPSLTDVVSEIDWQPVIVNSATTGIITGGVTWLMTSPKFTPLLNRIKSKLAITNISQGKQKILDYLNVRAVNGSGSLGKIGDNLINSVTGDIRKFSEYALTNPAKTGLFVDSWGYKLADADNLLAIYKKQAIQAVKEGKVIFNKTTQYGNEYKVITNLITPQKGQVAIYSGWIIKNENLDELILSTPFDGFVK